MKKLFLVFALAMLSFTASYAQQGEKSIGFKLNYGGYVSNMGIGVQFAYNVTDPLRIAPSMNYFFKSDGWSMFNVDVDAHYLFPFADKFAAYPIGGLTFQSWKWKYDNILGGYESASKFRFGLNVGAGIQYDINETWRAFSELKYGIVSEWAQFNATAGIAFKF